MTVVRTGQCAASTKTAAAIGAVLACLLTATALGAGAPTAAELGTCGEPPATTSATLPPGDGSSTTTAVVADCATTTTAVETTTTAPATTVATTPETVAATTTVVPDVSTTVTAETSTTVTPDTSTTTATDVSTTVTPDPSTTVAPVDVSTTVTADTSTTLGPVDASRDPAPTTVVVGVGEAAVDEATTTTIPSEETADPTADPETAPATPPAATEGGRVVDPVGLIDPFVVRAIQFPVAGPVSYGNDFNACRDQCRRFHRGVDLIGTRLQPVVAMANGVIDRFLRHPTAGNGVVIADAEGWEYHVYHLNNDTPGTDDGLDPVEWNVPGDLAVGDQVYAGQLIGWLGDSGNAETSVPHVHVEIHRPDGSAINPYWSLTATQRAHNCAVVPAEPPTDDAAATVAGWLETGWLTQPLPTGWLPLAIADGDETTARMWLGPDDFQPVDAGALAVGDGRRGDCSVTPSTAPEIDAVLATIRLLESGNNYRAQSTSSTASGAYQFVNGTWGAYAGYATARAAPVPVQDDAARRHVAHILATHGGDVSAVPVVWYLGHVPSGAAWDTVPAAPGNTLTPRQYQARWLQTYQTLAGQQAVVAPVPPSTPCRPALDPAATPPATTLVNGYVADPAGLATPFQDPAAVCRPPIIDALLGSVAAAIGVLG